MPSSRNATYMYMYEVRSSEETPFEVSRRTARRSAYCRETSVEYEAVVKSSCEKGVRRSRSKHVSYCFSSTPLAFQLLLCSPWAEYLSVFQPCCLSPYSSISGLRLPLLSPHSCAVSLLLYNYHFFKTAW